MYPEVEVHSLTEWCNTPGRPGWFNKWDKSTLIKTKKNNLWVCLEIIWKIIQFILVLGVSVKLLLVGYFLPAVSDFLVFINWICLVWNQFKLSGFVGQGGSLVRLMTLSVIQICLVSPTISWRGALIMSWPLHRRRCPLTFHFRKLSDKRLGQFIWFFCGLLGVIRGRFLSIISSAAHPRWPILDLVSVDYLTNASVDWFSMSERSKFSVQITKTSRIFNIQVWGICHALPCSCWYFALSVPYTFQYDHTSPSVVCQGCTGTKICNGTN
jgi:hypothetical protein